MEEHCVRVGPRVAKQLTNALRQNLLCSLPTRNKTLAKKGNTSVPTVACEENISHPGRRKAIFLCPYNVYT